MKKILILTFISLYVAGVAALKAETSTHYEVTEREIVYKVVDGYQLKMIIYEPVLTEKHDLPAIVFYFGGGWNVGTRKLFQYHARYLASRGMVAFSPDYRVGSRVPGTKVADCVKDGKSAFRYIKQNAEALGVDTNKIVASGTSAGGLLAADLPLVDRFNEITDDSTVVTTPCAEVLYCPAIRVEHDLLNDAYKERFDGQEEALSPYHNVRANTPPYLIMAGVSDTQVLIGDMRAFKSRMEEFGNVCELLEYPGQGHGFCLYDRSPYYFRETLRATENFLEDVLDFENPSWIDDYVTSLGAVITEPAGDTDFTVGPNGIYKKISDAWKVIADINDSTDFLIRVEAGTYSESEMRGMPDKKITIIGAGAGKTIVTRDARPGPMENFTEERRYGYLFRSPKNVAAEDLGNNFELVCKDMSFEYIGSMKNNWGGALVICEVANQKYTFKNCNFNNIYARQSSLVSSNPASETPFSFTMDSCFVENCGTYEFNYNSGMMTFKYGGEVVIKNTTFINNRFYMYNLDDASANAGVDLNRKSGLILQLTAADSYPTDLMMENVNILNTSVNAETTSFCPEIKIVGTASSIASCQLNKVIVVGNYRNSTPDCDVFISSVASVVPTIEGSVFNIMKEDESVSMSSYPGATLGTDLTYTSSAVDFVMDDDLPQIFETENGVKYLKQNEVTSGFIPTGLKSLQIGISGNELTLSGLSGNEHVFVYDITGKQIKNITSPDALEKVCLNRGVYLVKIGTFTRKVIL